MCFPFLAPAVLAGAGPAAAGLVGPAAFGLAGPLAGGAVAASAFSFSSVLSVLGGITSLFGQQQTSQANVATAQFQAAVARNNAIIADRAAADARARGDVASAQRATQTRLLLGRQRVAQAGLGQLVGTGSALDLNVDLAATGKLEELQIANAAEREAIGFLTQAGNFRSEQQLALARAGQEEAARPTRLLGTALTTAAKVSDRFSRRGLTFIS